MASQASEVVVVFYAAPTAEQLVVHSDESEVAPHRRRADPRPRFLPGVTSDGLS